MSCASYDSILSMTKKLLMITPSMADFDPDIMSAINSAIFTLKQLGVPTKDGKMVTDETVTYQDLYGETNPDIDIEAIKQYIYCKTRIVFDPPQSNALLGAVKDQMQELEWRIRLSAELREEEFEEQMSSATEIPNDKIQEIWDEAMNKENQETE